MPMAQYSRGHFARCTPKRVATRIVSSKCFGRHACWQDGQPRLYGPHIERLDRIGRLDTRASCCHQMDIASITVLGSNQGDGIPPAQWMGEPPTRLMMPAGPTTGVRRYGRSSDTLTRARSLKLSGATDDVDGWTALWIFIGAGLGALLRWALALAFNPLFPTVPLGTLAANVIGGFLMGIALGFIAEYETLSPGLRLAATTGFLGGLTTFSTFSAETITTLLRQEYTWASAIVAVHVIGSLLATLGGLGVTRWLFET
jgi:CrcB protein